MISAIVAVDENWGIGYQNELLAHIPEDLKRFKEITAGHIIIMGRKTWDSLPHKPLKNRINVIISSQPPVVLDALSVRMNLEQAIQYVTTPILENLDFFIIGGGSIYKYFLPLCERIYVTKIHKNFSCVDTYFPNLDNMGEWIISSHSDTYSYDGLDYSFVEYSRVN